MNRLLSILILSGIFIVAESRGDKPLRPAPVENTSEDGLPYGKWRVEFTNGVVQACVVDKKGAAAVTEPLRQSSGTAMVKDQAVIITFDDDRTERWTMVGKRWVVEHWCPSSQFPSGPAVRGIADRVE